MNAWAPASITAAPASAVALLATIALIARRAGRGVPGCAPGSGCDAIASSRWARIGPLPVTAPAFVAYALMLVCAVVASGQVNDSDPPPMRPELVFLASLCAVAAVWFLGLQALVVRRFCVYCVMAHVAALVAAAAILTTAPLPSDLMPALLGVAAALVFATLQITFRPELARFTPTPLSERSEDPDAVTPQPRSAPIASAPAVPSPPAPSPAPRAASFRPMSSPRRVALLGGRLLFDASLFPFLGSPGAPHLIAVLSDYTCEHCRAMHPILQSALRQTRGQMVVLILPAPLERACNPHVEVSDPRYVNACTYARLALAVWVARPGCFAAFHDFLNEGVRPPSPDVARSRAAELLGSAAELDAVIDAPLVQQKLADALTVYRLTGTVGTTGGAVGALPRVILPSGILHGGSSSAEKFLALLEEQLLSGPPASLSAGPPPSPRAGGAEAPPPSVFSSSQIRDARQEGD